MTSQPYLRLATLDSLQRTEWQRPPPGALRLSKVPDPMTLGFVAGQKQSPFRTEVKDYSCFQEDGFSVRSLLQALMHGPTKAHAEIPAPLSSVLQNATSP